MEWLIWTTLAVALVVVFLLAVSMWSRRQAAQDDVVPTGPPAGPGAEGMNVTDPGEISPGDPGQPG